MGAPDWLHDAIFYQIFPERFANGDRSLDPEGVVPWGSRPTRENFFGGDLAGIIEHLDHIERLGANAIYLTPIFEADTNHRYDAKDYFAIDHRLGTIDTFRRLVGEAHARGIRVVLDAVLNHSGDGHWAFRDAVEKEEASPYVNWYSIESFPVAPFPEPNYRTCSGCYYLPKWNVYNPEVRAHHFEVARHWIREGIDGWRLDVPYFINRNFWRQFRNVVKEHGEDLYIVAEEWRDPAEWLQGDIADGTMNYTLRDLILGFTADAAIDAVGAQTAEAALRARIPDEYRHGMLNLLGSHDTERVLTRHAGSVDRALLAYALLLSAQGAPMIYYGDEVGMQGGNDPDCRGAMPWREEDWDSRLLAAVREMTSLRQAEPALRRGGQRMLAWSADVLGLLRGPVDGRFVVTVVNRGTADARVTLPADAAGWHSLAGACSAVEGNAIIVPARAYAVLAGTETGEWW